ncbi:MAG TPA: polysaccharide biosynthesis protein [Terriglobales bacterium]|nr:polysaccharide biosynthesis protein [Terriglobales bacterium]
MPIADRENWYRELLGRAPFELPLVNARMLAGKRIFVTGGAGSIGSELVRRVRQLNPAELIVFDNAEDRLYQLYREFRAKPGQPELILGDINSVDELELAFTRHRPEIVFHAAAHKYVDFLESQILAAVRTNVFGTRNVLAASAVAGVECVVVLSSDKATNPASVLGATKRAAELMVLQTAAPAVCSVRLCNVLGTAGSLLPLVLEQAERGVVTVTDNQAERYFVAPNEAAQLLLSAAIAKEPGIFVPVNTSKLNIRNLVEKILRASNRTAMIQIVGLRPGEKQAEELYSNSEQLSAARAAGLLKVTKPVEQSTPLFVLLDRLEDAHSRRDENAVIDALLTIVPEYKPSFALRNSVTR